MIEKSLNKQLDARVQYPASSRILLSGKAFVAHISGALYWPAEDSLIVSDLNLGQSNPEPFEGVELSVGDHLATLYRLADVVNQFQPKRVIVVGNSLPVVRGGDASERKVLSLLDTICQGRDWLWICGEAVCDLQDMLPGQVLSEFALGGLTFRQSPIRASVSHEVAGCMHPVAKITRHGKVESARCFVSTGTRLIMPSFGVDQKGVNVLDRRFDPLFGGDTMFAWIAGRNDVYPVAARQLLED